MSERTHHDGSAGRAYTVEQKAAVLRIKRCAPTAYYEILGLEEELFRQFFGGGFGAPFGGFDTAPGFVFNLGGGPGVRVHQFGGGRPRRRPGTAQPPGREEAPGLGGALGNLLPLLFLFVLPLLSSLFSGGSSSSGPSFAFTPQREYTCLHKSQGAFGVNYYVAPSVCNEYGSNPRDKRWKSLDNHVESSYVHTLEVKCNNEELHAKQEDARCAGVVLRRRRSHESSKEYEKTQLRFIGQARASSAILSGRCFVDEILFCSNYWRGRGWV